MHLREAGLHTSVGAQPTFAIAGVQSPPVAMGGAERIGGLPSLTAAIVICSGIVGAALGPALLTLLGVTDWRARGLAIGTAAHGIGPARAILVNEVAGAFNGLAMRLNALATALLLPLLWRLFFG